jgi:hypothetical protein
VRLAFMLAALNGLDILAADAEGAYLNAPSREKLYMKFTTLEQTANCRVNCEAIRRQLQVLVCRNVPGVTLGHAK